MLKIVKRHQCFGGSVTFHSHDSKQTSTAMAFSTYMPETKPRGCVIWLSGLTCTEENFVAKAGALRLLNETSLMVICPDTSPRGLNLPEEHTSWDFGSGAGFYVDATTPGYRDHYRMYSYVTQELYDLIQKNFPVGENIAIMGHSMGGHGAMIMGLREGAKFKSVSAFSPIVNPVNSPWGQKAFRGYLGEDSAAWKNYDATELVLSGKNANSVIRIDQGERDDFLATQLLTQNFAEACRLRPAQETEICMRQGYDHSYYFISTFIGQHIAFHAKHL